MDIILICLEYTGEYTGEASVKSMLYAFKLKLEVAVLNQLVGLIQAGLTDNGRWGHDMQNADHRGISSSNGPEWSHKGGANNAKEKPVSGRHELREIYKTQHIGFTSEVANGIQQQT